MNEVRIEDVAIGYGKKVVAQGLTAVLHSGQLTCLIGRNGLGKSTFLRTIAGFQRPLKGKITGSFDKEGICYDLTRLSKQALSRLVAVVLTEKVDLANMTVREIVSMGRMPYTDFFGKLREEDEEIVTKAIEMTRITDLAKRDISTLSDGERQKVMIARALAQHTPVILLDEPTAFLDYESKVETMKLMQSLAHNMGKIIIASTHDLDIAVRYADRMITINGGIKEVDKTDLKRIIS